MPACHCWHMARLPIAKVSVTGIDTSGDGQPDAGSIDRRGFIAGAVAGALALAGCTSGPPTAADTGTDRVRAQVAADEASLIAQYATTIAALPQLAASLQPIMQEHQAHLAAMGARATESATPAGRPPGSPDQALAALADAERAAAQQRREACVASGDAELARILALIAASEAAHIPALGGIRA